MTAICETRWFGRWAKKEGLNALALCAALAEMKAGFYEADLGGGLLKKRDREGGAGQGRVGLGSCWPLTKTIDGCSSTDFRKTGEATSIKTSARR